MHRQQWFCVTQEGGNAVFMLVLHIISHWYHHSTALVAPVAYDGQDKDGNRIITFSDVAKHLRMMHIQRGQFRQQ